MPGPGGLLVLARAAGYLVYVYEQLPTPREVGDLESKFVHLAWRVQAGVRLYPPWRDYPHVTNFFSPGYFLVVGRIGSLAGAELQGLFLIGRAVTVACALATAVVLWWVVRRCDGPVAGVLGAIASLAPPPMMARHSWSGPTPWPNCWVCSDFFWPWPQFKIASCRCRHPGRGDLHQADRGRLPDRGLARRGCFGRARAGGDHVGGGVAAVGVVVAVVNVFEPMFVSSLLGEGKTRWDFGEWASQLLELGTSARPVHRTHARTMDLALRPAPTAHPGHLVAGCLRIGPDHGCQAGLGTQLLYEPPHRGGDGDRRDLRERPGSPGPVSGQAHRDADWSRAVSLVPGTILSVRNAWLSRLDARFYSTTEGQRFLVAQREYFRLAEDSSVRLLTDSGLLQLYQKAGAPFVDPFQFRHMVNSGQIHPELIRKQLQNEFYDLVITTSDLNRSAYETSTSSFPEVLAQSARVHYVAARRELGLFIYIPRGACRGFGLAIEPER